MCGPVGNMNAKIIIIPIVASSIIHLGENKKYGPQGLCEANDNDNITHFTHPFGGGGGR